MRGILDRFEKDIAVILIEEKKEEFTVPKSQLPEESKIDTYFFIEKTADGYQITGIDMEKTDQETKKASSLMDQLKAKKKTSKFKKN